MNFASSRTKNRCFLQTSVDFEPKQKFPHLSLIYLDLKSGSVEKPLLETHLACKEVSNDLDYNLVLLIRCLVPGHHHFSTRQVLQLIYLQPGERKLDSSRFHARSRRHPASEWFTVLPPFPMTRPAAKEGTLM